MTAFTWFRDDRLSERGQLLPATPAAEIVTEGEAEAEILAALPCDLRWVRSDTTASVSMANR